MTKFVNKQREADDVIKWLHQNISATKRKPLSVGLNNDGTIRLIETSIKLSVTDKEKITTEFPELNNKEVNQKS